MKKIILFSFITVFIISCDRNPENIESELVGKWILKEVLQDPGDGSGVYRPATSNKIIEFYASGVITSNASLCNMSAETAYPETGTYSLADSTITAPACSQMFFNLRFRQVGSVLYIYYPCIEGCSEKYLKLK